MESNHQLVIIPKMQVFYTPQLLIWKIPQTTVVLVHYKTCTVECNGIEPQTSNTQNEVIAFYQRPSIHCINNDTFKSNGIGPLYTNNCYYQYIYYQVVIRFYLLLGGITPLDRLRETRHLPLHIKNITLLV